MSNCACASLNLKRRRAIRYYLDSEFIDDGHTIDLISIGIVCEDGRELYAQSCEFNLDRANEWVMDNVIPYLDICPYIQRDRHSCKYDLAKHERGQCFPRSDFETEKHRCPWRTRAQLKQDVLAFIDIEKYGEPEIWTYYGAYDHVAFCQLFGTMMDLPHGFPMHTMDIKQWCKMLGNPRLPEQGKGEHNALEDARHNQVMWTFLHEYEAKHGNAWTPEQLETVRNAWDRIMAPSHGSKTSLKNEEYKAAHVHPATSMKTMRILVTREFDKRDLIGFLTLRDDIDIPPGSSFALGYRILEQEGTRPTKIQVEEVSLVAERVQSEHEAAHVHPASALLAFVGWLTSRTRVSGPFSGHHEAKEGADLVKAFCDAQGWHIEQEEYDEQIRLLKKSYPKE